MSEIVEHGDPALRRIWLTAADSALGLALAKQLLEAGHHLALTALAQTHLLELVRRYPGQVLLVIGDVSDGVQLRQMADRIDEHWGALDTAICNAKPYTLAEAALAQGVPCADILTTSLFVQESLPLLRRGHRAHLVAISSPESLDDQPHGKATADLRQVFKALRIDLAGESIDVSVIDPHLSSPQAWPTIAAARYIVEQLACIKRGLDISKPARLIATVKNRMLKQLPSSKKDT